MKTITIAGQIRTDFGKAATRQLRSEDKVPGVIYGGAKEVNFSAPASAFKSIVYTPDFMLAEIKIAGNAYKCVLKDIQFDKVTDKLIHVDFLELVGDKKITVSIPMQFTGTPEGVKEGGKLTIKMKSLKVKTLPEHLVEHIDVDLTDLKLNENIRVQDVKAANMEIMNSPRIPIASVAMTRQLKQEEAATSTTAAPVATAAADAKAAPAAATAAKK
ncbi:MAG TPA: 50S ribosomal protein L25 [Chitinophagaceae bacterium]|nr:50S ribosomal protein L25 [Chitinophagaceae bacterium]